MVGRQHVTTQADRHELGAVADAQDRDAATPDGAVGMRRTLVIDRVGAARQDDGAHATPLQLGHGGVEREQLGVDVELPDPARDELRELAAEVQDGDGVGGLVDGGRWPVRGVALRGGRVERDLEVRLDLGVVGREDTVARVGK